MSNLSLAIIITTPHKPSLLSSERFKSLTLTLYPVLILSPSAGSGPSVVLVGGLSLSPRHPPLLCIGARPPSSSSSSSSSPPNLACWHYCDGDPAVLMMKQRETRGIIIRPKTIHNPPSFFFSFHPAFPPIRNDEIILLR